MCISDIFIQINNISSVNRKRKKKKKKKKIENDGIASIREDIHAHVDNIEIETGRVPTDSLFLSPLTVNLQIPWKESKKKTKFEIK